MRRWRWAVAIALLGLGVGCATPAPRASTSYADFLVGRVANARGDHEVAADRYFAALSRAPRNESFAEGALISALAGGDVDRARLVARRTPREDALALVHLTRAAEALAARRADQAADALDAVEGAAAEEMIARMLRVWASTADGRVDDVLMDLAPLVSLRPYGGLFAYQQAMALDVAGRQEDALAAYEIAPRGGLLLAQGVERRADLLARNGQRGGAQALLSEEANAQHPALEAARARLLAGESVSSAPLTPARGASAGLFGLASIFLQEGDTSNGFSALTLSLMLDPQADASRLAFAQALSARGRHDEALRMADAIGDGSDYVGASRRLRSWILLDAGRGEEALAQARANAADSDARSLRALADILRALDRAEEAEPIYVRLTEIVPEDWRAHLALGAARQSLGRWSEAEAALLRALALSPEQPDVLNFLGYTWADRGERLDEALPMLQRAADLRPTSGAIIDSLGWAYFRMGDYPRALELLERAVLLQPGSAILNDHLGDAYWRAGRRVEARFQWRRALALEPDDALAIQQKLVNGLPDEIPAPAR